MKKYKCPLCPKKYQSENDVKRHLKKIHGNIEYPEGFNNYFCRCIYQHTNKLIFKIK